MAEREVAASSFGDGEYDQEVDITSHVFAADVKQHTFLIQTTDQATVMGTLPPELEHVVLSALSEHETRVLRVGGRGHFSNAGSLVRIDPVEWIGSPNATAPPPRPSIWNALTQLAVEMPQQERDSIPDDLSRNLDHYLYGAPKQD